MSTAWIPGNLLSEGTLFVRANLVTLNPNALQFAARDVVAFQVIDSLEALNEIDRAYVHLEPEGWH